MTRHVARMAYETVKGVGKGSDMCRSSGLGVSTCNRAALWGAAARAAARRGTQVEEGAENCHGSGPSRLRNTVPL